MNAGTIFVLLLGIGFLVFVLYLARLSRKSQADGTNANRGEQRTKDSDKPRVRGAG